MRRSTLWDLRQQVYRRLEEALSLLQSRDLLSGARGKDVQSFIRRVLSVQADGFLRNGVRLTQREKRTPAPGPAKKAVKSGR